MRALEAQTQDAFGLWHGTACLQEKFPVVLIIISLRYLETQKRNISANSASYRKLLGAHSCNGYEMP